jgi:histidyl-tRNA synthetase
MGFAMGVERLVAVLESLEIKPGGDGVDAYLVPVGEAASSAGMLLAEQLRDALPALKLQINCGGGSFKSQFKKADRSGARVALILGDDEIADELIGVKWLREEREQVTIKQDELVALLSTED